MEVSCRPLLKGEPRSSCGDPVETLKRRACRAEGVAAAESGMRDRRLLGARTAHLEQDTIAGALRVASGRVEDARSGIVELA